MSVVQGDKQEAERFVEEADGFAEVFPEHKYAIVEMLQNRHHTAAMTGATLNSSPSPHNSHLDTEYRIGD